MAENSINAGVVVVTRFCNPMSNTFGTYIDYIDRTEAKRNEALSAYNLYNDYNPYNDYSSYNDYMSNPDKTNALSPEERISNQMRNPKKTTGLFTRNKMELNREEKQQLKNVFNQARHNGSLMWQTVISFDNRWLAEHGLYDSEKKIIDERKIKEIATGGIEKMLKNEGLENSVWSAAIHYNTDNIHIHIATVEPMPARPMKEYTVYREEVVDGKKKKIPVRDSNGNVLKSEEYVGRFKQKSIELCKKHVVDEILGQREQNILINKIIREDILKQKAEHILSTDADLKDNFMKIYQCLPRTGNRGLWNYNNNAMNRVRPMLDELTKAYIEKYNAEDYKTFIRLLTKQSQDYKTAYGINGKRDFKESKIKELYERLGNQILKEMKEFDKQTGGTEYKPGDAEIIMEEFYEQMQVLEEAEADKNIDDDIFLDIDDLDPDHMGLIWSDNYKLAKKLIYGKVKDLQRGYELLNSEAREGNVLAIYEIGNLYQRGIRVEIEPEKANYYFEKALHGFENIYEYGNKFKQKVDAPYLEYRIGKMHYYGQGTEKDYEQAFEYLKRSADSKNIYAAYTVGNMYYNGEGMEIDKSQAFKYYTQAIDEAKKGRENPYAYYKVAQMYERGEVAEKNETKAYEYYSYAYQKFEKLEKDVPDSNTEYKLGIMLLNGKGVEKDLVKAEQYLEMSAKNGNIYAQCEYAKVLLAKGDEENAKKAISMLRKSALKNNEVAQYILGKVYAEDERFYNESQAIRFLSMAANKNKFAEYKLGKIYSNENSKYYNKEKAIQYFTGASEKGNEYADYHLGKMYSDEKSEYYNMRKAIYHFEKASEIENKYAKYKLGSIYARRDSEYYNPQKAIENLTSIADEGNVFAQYKLGKLYMDKDTETYNPEKGIYYLEKASEQGNEYADIELGFIYLTGNGVPVNKLQAEDYFHKAAESGNEFAKKMVEQINKPRISARSLKGQLRPNLGIKNRGAYDMERALNSLKKSFNDTFKNQRIIAMHEKLLEQEKREKEQAYKQEINVEIEEEQEK